MTLRLLAAIVLSLVGGVVAWLGGRRILRHIGDPLFVDRMFAHRMAMVRIYMLMMIPIVLLANRNALWIGALLLLSIAVGGFPARKRVFDENWTLPEYLGNRIRMAVFIGGLWLAVLLAPSIVQAVGLAWWPAVLVALIVSFFFYHDLLLFGFGSEPLRDQALLERFEPILAKANAPRPRFFEGGPRTGRFTNAVALPRGKRSRILFTRTLLLHLEPAEVAAIFAHELAHIEHYTQRRMRMRIWLSLFLLPALAVLPQVLVLKYAPAETSWTPIIWPLLLIFSLLGALIRRQKNETEADLRALQLGADPLALIGGLEKLHQLNRVPRRFDAKREQRMSHPSLARRIQAIRRAAGIELEAAPPSLPKEFAAAGQIVRFTPEELETGERAYRYDALNSLTLRKTIRGFDLAGRSGSKRFRVSIDPASAADIHNILDWVDSRLAPPQAAAERVSRNSRLVAALLLLISLFPGISFPPMVMSFVALICPNASILAALGATAIAAGATVFTRPSQPLLEAVIPAIAVVEILLGVICLLLIRRIPADERERHLRTAVIVLSILALIVLLPSMIGFNWEQPALQLFLAARSRPSVAILLIGIGAALAVSGRRHSAIAVAAGALAFFACGTLAFALMSGSDPLLTDREPSWVKAPAPAVTRRLDRMASRLRLSPDGTMMAVQTSRGSDDDDSVGGKFGVGGVNAPLRDISARDVAFARNGRLLRLQDSDSGTDLDMVDSNEWKVRLPPLVNPQLSVESDGVWRISGVRPRNYAPAQFTGRIGSPSYLAESHGRTSTSWISMSSAAGSGGVLVATMLAPPLVRGIPLSMLLSPFAGPTEFRRTSGRSEQRLGRTVLAARDVAWLPDSGRWAIVGHDATSTYVGTVDAGAKSIRAAGALSGHARRGSTGSGSRIALLTSSQAVIVWSLQTGRAMRLQCRQCMALDTSFADHAVGVLWMRGGGVEADIYSTSALEQ